jgi:hypothetical protein
MVSERKREYMNEYYNAHKEYYRLRYLNEKVSKLLKMDLPSEEIEKLIIQARIKYETKKRLRILEKEEEKKAEAKRRYDFIYN